MHDLLPTPSEHDTLRPVQRNINIAGPCIPAQHTLLPALDRLPGVRQLITCEQYFVVHAPRQTDKMVVLKSSAIVCPPFFQPN